MAIAASQTLSEKRVVQWINHNDLTTTIHLFLRTDNRRQYTCLGKLKYLTHDIDREKPVWFQWQILDWNISEDKLAEMNLFLSSENGDAKLDVLPESRDKLIVREIPKINRVQGKRTHDFKNRKQHDYATQDARNRKLGELGELLVLNQEIGGLRDAGLDELSAKVSHVSAVLGDGAGYDILSFDKNGSEKYIEVKTTKGNENTSFHMSPNEIEFSKQHKENYHLYRLYKYDESRNSAEMYVLSGNIEDLCEFQPTAYRVNLIPSHK